MPLSQLWRLHYTADSSMAQSQESSSASLAEGRQTRSMAAKSCHGEVGRQAPAYALLPGFLADGVTTAWSRSTWDALKITAAESFHKGRRTSQVDRLPRRRGGFRSGDLFQPKRLFGPVGRTPGSHTTPIVALQCSRDGNRGEATSLRPGGLGHDSRQNPLRSVSPSRRAAGLHS